MPGTGCRPGPWIAAAEGLGRDAEVVEALSEMAAAKPGAKTGALAEVLIRSGRAAEAEELLRRRAVIDDLVYSDLLRMLVDLLLRQGREDAVRELIAGPAGRWAAAIFAAFLEKRGDRDAALATLAPFGTADHDRQLAYGTMLLRAGRLAEATAVLVTLDSGVIPGLGLNALCRALAERGRHVQALALIDDAADQAGGMTTGLLTLRATTLADGGDVDRGISPRSGCSSDLAAQLGQGLGEDLVAVLGGAALAHVRQVGLVGLGA